MCAVKQVMVNGYARYNLVINGRILGQFATRTAALDYLDEMERDHVMRQPAKIF